MKKYYRIKKESFDRWKESIKWPGEEKDESAYPAMQVALIIAHFKDFIDCMEEYEA
jgi:hypothetical protein